jgi:hypothetical protein
MGSRGPERLRNTGLDYRVNFTILGVLCSVHSRKNETDAIVTFYISVFIRVYCHSVYFQSQYKSLLYDVPPVLVHENFIQQVHMVVVPIQCTQVFKEMRKNTLIGCAQIKTVSLEDAT